MYGAVDSPKTPATAGETKVPHDTEGGLKTIEDDSYPHPGFWARRLDGDHLYFSLAGLLLLHISCFTFVLYINNFVQGIEQHHPTKVLNFFVGIALCLFLLLFWYDNHRREQEETTKQQSTDPKTLGNVPLSEFGTALDAPSASKVDGDVSGGSVSFEVKSDRVTAPKVRVMQIDTAKTLVIMNVVFLHTVVCIGAGWGAYNDTSFINAYNYSIEPIILPSMAWSSGFVAKLVVSAKDTRENVKLLCGFFIWQAVYMCMLKFVVYRKFLALGAADVTSTWCFAALWNTNEDPLPVMTMLNNIFICPFYHMWYLWALIAWRFVIPIWMELKHPFYAALLASIYMSHVQISWGGDKYDQTGPQRMVGYFPYFVMGVVCKKHGSTIMRFTQLPQAKVWAVAVLVIHVGVLSHGSMQEMCINSIMPHTIVRLDDCTLGRDAATGLLAHPGRYWLNSLARILAVIGALVANLAVLTLLPSGENVLSRAGSRSLVPYVGHYLMFMLVVSFTNLADDNASVFKMLPVFAIMAAWTFFLFLPQVHDNVVWTMRPPLEKVKWLFVNK